MVSCTRVLLCAAFVLAAYAPFASAQTITEFPLPAAGSSPSFITAGHDGDLWFTERFANKIGRITTAGVITEFPIPTAASEPIGITTGPDRNVWFTELRGNKIGRIIIGDRPWKNLDAADCADDFGGTP